jgi:HprK-related kinase B
MTARPGVAELCSNLERTYPAEHALSLSFGGVILLVQSNSSPLLDSLREYFGALCLSTRPERPDVVFCALEAEAPDFGLDFREWPREPGKASQKERYADLEGGRIIYKVRTRMQFLIGREQLLAIGPCRANANQIINFINSQYISRRLQEGWALCHAAGVAHAGRGLGIAARAGAGKSTLALRLMSTGLSFVSNDRLLLQHTERGAQMAGIPKMPRVNPGTLLNNPELERILPDERRRALAGLGVQEIWNLEEKYDVLVDDAYGPGRAVYLANLAALIILNWSWKDEAAPTRFTAVDLDRRPDLLELVMKSPGVFYRDEHGPGTPEATRPDPRLYLDSVRGTRIWEATGRPNFELGVSFCRRVLEAD